MSNGMRKVLSVFIAVLMVAVLLPTASLAGTSVHVYDVPNFVGEVIVNLTGNNNINCSANGSKWAGSDNGSYVTDDIVSITLKWGANTEVVQRSSLTIGIEGGGSGTLKIDLLSGWNTTSISGTKTWVDSDNAAGHRPTEVTVSLFADGVYKEQKTVTATGSWQYSFENLPKYGTTGSLINYTVEEGNVPDYYTSSVSGYNITNTFEVITVSGTKTWGDDNNRDGKRPSTINVKVLDGGTEVASQAISSPWTYEFTGLPKYRDGSLIVYAVDEDPVTGYSKTVNGLNITNAHTPETVTISGTKTWDIGTDPQPPTSITVNVKKGDDIAATATVVSPWTYQFTLPKYENGTLINYTVEEEPVANYTPAYTQTNSGVDILNTYTPPVTPKGILRLTKSVSGTDAQDTFEFTVDGPNAYHTHITLHGSAFMDITDLALGDYIVEEINIPAGYAVDAPNPKTIKVEAATTPSSITFINTYTPQKGSLTVTKVVTGAAAPTTPAVYSYSVTGPNGYTDSFTITGALNHTLTGLAPGSYTVTEDVPAGSAFTVDDADQTTTVTANQTAQLTFTNTYTPADPETGTITIKKHVEGEGAPPSDEFEFSIQRVVMAEQVSVMAYAPFTLEDGEEITLSGLVPGQYLITETDWPDGYEPKSVSKLVTVNAGENPDVIFTNEYKHKDPPAQTYSVSYHPNGGLGNVPVDMTRYYPGDKAFLKSGAGLYRPNYVFAGWSLINGTRVNDPYIMGRSDVTFFAIWVPVKVPKTGDQATPYGLLMISGALILAALNLLGKRKHTAK